MESSQPHDDQTRTTFGFPPGTAVAQYTIVSKVGAGGMGEVYLAEDTRLGRRVALKFLPKNLCTDQEMRRRFVREAQAAAKLDHPNIVPVYEVGEYQGDPYFSMVHVEGRSLRDIIRSDTPKMSWIYDIGIQLSEGLQAAHDKGIVHRDIKPSNILIDMASRARIADFGLASVAATDELTKTGSTIGTLGYMSPEQVRGDKTDHRSDLFSLGVVLYELVTGRAPFAADNQATVLNLILNNQPKPPSEYRSDLPQAFQHIILKLLEKSPAQRYQSARDVSDDLKNISLHSRSEIAVASPDKPSIAVLPFANLSTDPEQEYFCDGIAEDVINALTNVAGLRVVARTSAFAFKGQNKDIRQIGRELNVGTILEGSVRKSGNKIRVTGQLINVADGFHLWSERYDRTLDDIFAIQDDISLAIVNQLKIKLLHGEEQAIRKRVTSNLEAHNHYLKGRYSWNRRTKKSLNQAIQSFEQAVALDPDFALAYTGMAEVYAVQFSSDSDNTDLGQKARAMARKALEIDPSLTEPYCTLAVVAFLEWRWDEAVVLFKKAVTLNPNYPTAYHWWAIALAAFGRFDLALEHIEKARRLDPLSIAIAGMNCICYYSVRQFEKAVALGEEYRDLGETLPFYHLYYASSLIETGKVPDAREHVNKAIELLEAEPEQNDRNRKLEFFAGSLLARLGETSYGKQRLEKALGEDIPTGQFSDIAQLCIALGRRDEGITWFEKAIDAKSSIMSLMWWSPFLDSVKEDPRFQAALKRSGLQSVNID
jgi:serine/threonine protein kinase